MSTIFTQGRFSAEDAAGAPLVGGLLHTYSSGTTTPKATYSDPGLTAANTNPIALNARGEAQVWLGSGAYSMRLTDAAGVTIWTVDGITSADAAGVGQAAADALRADLASLDATKGAALVGLQRPEAGGAMRTVRAKLMDGPVSILDFGADPTGVALCNGALDAAKAVCKTVLFPPGVYRIENYTLEDLRLVGCNADGANYGPADATTIQGSGDIFVQANNFSLDSLTLKNTASGSLGKLISVKDIDTAIGPIRNCRFLRAAYHIYHSSSTKTIVGAAIQGCLFREATEYSRFYYNAGLFQYSEIDCYTGQNARGLMVRACSTALISASVFEFHDRGAVYVTNTDVSSDVIRGLKFEAIHFEQNGNVTPTADVTITVTPSLGRIDFDSCSFLASTVAGNVDLASSPNLRISESNCKDISYANLAVGTVVTTTNPKQAGRRNGLHVNGGTIETNERFISRDGLAALSSLGGRIYNSATATPVTAPPTGSARLILASDATSGGAALLMLSGTSVTVISNTISAVTWSIVSGYLHGQTTGGSSFRDMFYTAIET